MSGLFYTGLVVAGAVTLVIEAYRNFNSTTARHPFELHPILKEVEVRNLCTTGEIVVGFAFYAFLYLVAYAVLLSSAEVYALLAQANSALGQIGATDTEVGLTDPAVGDLISLSSDNSKPIMVSALIISSLSLGAVKPIEMTMRSLAHRMAGVPRGVYKVIETLKSIDYEELMRGQPAPLATLFIGHDPSTDGASDALKHWRSQILRALYSIDCLKQATDPNGRNLYFPLHSLERLKAVSKTIDDRYGDLREAIESLPIVPANGSSVSVQNGETPKAGKQKDSNPNSNRDQPQADPHTKYAELAAAAETLSANIMAYFAVLFIRNNRAIFSPKSQAAKKESSEPPADSPVTAIKKRVCVPEKDEHNAFALSLFCAFVLSFLITIGLYYLWRSWYGAADPNLYAEFILGKGNLNADLTQCPSEHQQVCEGALNEWLRTQFGDILKTTTWDQIMTFGITLMAVLLVIIGRDIRKEEQSWPERWRFHQFPFLRFLFLSIFSGLAASFMAALVRGGALAWDADFNLTENQIIGLFRDWGLLFALQFGAGIILAMTALTIMDLHHDFKMAGTLGISAAGGVIYYCYQWAILFISVPFPPDLPGAYFSQTVRDALILSALPFCFLVIFGFILELGEKPRAASEKDEDGKRPSGRRNSRLITDPRTAPQDQAAVPDSKLMGA